MHIHIKKIYLAGAVGFFIMFAAVPAKAASLPWDVTTFLGSPYGLNNVSKTSTSTFLDFAEDVTVDKRNGDFYIADTRNNAIRRVSKGTITTFTGTGSYGDTTDPRSRAELGEPRGVAISSDGKVFIADTKNNKIKKVSNGLVSVLTSGLKQPEGVATYSRTLYIADTGNSAIKYISINGGALRTLAQGSNLLSPKKIAISNDGKTLYVADGGSHKVVAINTATGAQTVLAGSGENKYKEGIGTAASFQNLWGIARDGNSLYVSDGNGFDDRVRKINISTAQTSLFASDSNMASLNRPCGIIIYRGNAYVANSGLGTIYRFATSNPTNDQEIYIGSDRFGNHDGLGRTSADIGRPYDLAKSSGNDQYLYLAENNKISEIYLPTGQRTALWGSSVDNYREGNATRGRASTISSLAVSSDRNTIYFVDTWNNRIRKIDRATQTSSWLSGIGNTNVAGSGNGYQEGAATVARFDNPRGIAISHDDKWLYVVDTSNARIRKVSTADGSTSLIAGSGVGWANGPKNVAKFNRPIGIAVDDSDTYLYVADSYYHGIRRVRISDGYTDTIAGTGSAGYRDGIGTKAFFSLPEYVEYSHGNLYVSEVGGEKIRKINLTTDAVTTIAGTKSARGYKNGGKADAKFDDPKGLAVIGNYLYLADTDNDVIRKIVIAK